MSILISWNGVFTNGIKWAVKECSDWMKASIHEWYKMSGKWKGKQGGEWEWKGYRWEESIQSQHEILIIHKVNSADLLARLSGENHTINNRGLTHLSLRIELKLAHWRLPGWPRKRTVCGSKQAQCTSHNVPECVYTLIWDRIVVQWDLATPVLQWEHHALGAQLPSSLVQGPGLLLIILGGNCRLLPIILILSDFQLPCHSKLECIFELSTHH